MDFKSSCQLAKRICKHFEDFMPSEINWSQQGECYVLPLTRGLGVVRYVETESRWGLPGMGRPGSELLFNGDRVSILGR